MLSFLLSGCALVITGGIIVITGSIGYGIGYREGRDENAPPF